MWLSSCDSREDIWEQQDASIRAGFRVACLWVKRIKTETKQGELFTEICVYTQQTICTWKKAVEDQRAFTKQTNTLPYQYQFKALSSGAGTVPFIHRTRNDFMYFTSRDFLRWERIPLVLDRGSALYAQNLKGTILCTHILAYFI